MDKKDSKPTLHMRIDKNLIKKIDKKAEEMGITRTALVTISITEYLKNHTKGV